MPYNNTKKIYSFDLFDTLVCRSVKQPKDVFKLVENFGDIKYRSVLLSCIGFAKLRVISEVISRKLSDKEEVTLEEIYKVLSIFIKNSEQVLLSEISCEISVIFKIEKNTEILKRLLRENKKCCITSDMYLPKAIIEKIVKDKVGVDDIDIFISSDIMKTKHTGSLYNFIKKYYDVEYEDIIHYGDNDYSDIYIAKNLGISTVLVEKTDKKSKSKNIFRILKPIGSNKNYDVFYELGFCIAGPCVWVTSKWLAENLEKEGIESIFFGARDGYLFNICFNKISNIKNQYFRISRRALFLPSFAVNTSHTNLLFEREENLTSQEFFERLDCNCPESLKHLIPYYNQETFMKELDKQGFQKNCEDELKNIRGYLDSIGFNGKVAFFDLGWRGSLQSALESITDAKVDIYGYYFGLVEKSIQSPKRKAYYFYDKKCKQKKLMLLQSLAFFEFLFTEPEQSLKRVHVHADNTTEFEFIKNEEPEYQLQMRENIFKGAESFFEIIEPIDKAFKLKASDYNGDLHKQIKLHINNPDRKVIDAFSKIKHSAAFGGTHTRNIIEKRKFSAQSYRESFWRSGYIKSLHGIDKVIGKSVHIYFYSLGGLSVLNLKKKIFHKIKMKNHE